TYCYISSDHYSRNKFIILAKESNDFKSKTHHQQNKQSNTAVIPIPLKRCDNREKHGDATRKPDQEQIRCGSIRSDNASVKIFKDHIAFSRNADAEWSELKRMDACFDCL